MLSNGILTAHPIAGSKYNSFRVWRLSEHNGESVTLESVPLSSGCSQGSSAFRRFGPDHGQSVYVLQCGECRHEYGANGSDIFQRRCPACQGGRPGLVY